MSATSTPTFDVLPDMRSAAAKIAEYAREKLDGVEVVSVGPLLGQPVPGGLQYSVAAIVPERGGKDFAPYYVMLDIAQDSFMASAYRIALIVALEEFFGRVQVFGSELTLVKYVQKEWPSETGNGRFTRRWQCWSTCRKTSRCMPVPGRSHRRSSPSRLCLTATTLEPWSTAALAE